MTPEEILKKLDQVEYGAWYDTESRAATPKEFDTDGFIYRRCSVAHPEELLSRRVGHCYDQSLYEWVHLEEAGYQPKMIYMELSDGDSHAAVIFKGKSSGRWMWIEHSWHRFRGIHGPYKSQKDVTIDILRKFCGSHPTKTKPDFFNPNVDVPQILKLKRISVDDFMRICGSKNRVVDIQPPKK